MLTELLEQNVVDGLGKFVATSDDTSDGFVEEKDFVFFGGSGTNADLADGIGLFSLDAVAGLTFAFEIFAYHIIQKHLPLCK